MKRTLAWFAVSALALFATGRPAEGRGFGGFRAGGFGGYRAGGFGGYRAGGYGGYAGYHSGGVVGPYGGYGYANRGYSSVVGPRGGYSTGGYRSGSYTTSRGGTINYAGAGRAATGPGGWSAGRAVGGAQVTTAGGRTYTTAGRAGGVQGPGGRTVAGASGVRTASGPRGTASSAWRGGVAIGPHGAVAGGSRAGVAVGAGGRVVAGGSRTVAGVTPYRTYYASSAALRTQGGYVRRNFRYYDAFRPGWYAGYPGAWYPRRWVVAGPWYFPTYIIIANFLSYPTVPIYYDYGSNVVYQDNQVYINGEPDVSAADYTQQATDLAAAGKAAKPAEQDEWQPLGVFALVQDDEKTSFNIFQLAVDKKGVLRGNYYNALTDANEPIYGSVDKKSQRAAWSVGSKKFPVYEAGIANLTREETPILVHFAKGKAQQMTLVRVEDKKKDNKQD